jgi:hypothetical protein
MMDYLKVKDATRQNVQAILWYFEQGLYTDLGLKSVPIDYVQAVEALENKIKNDIKDWRTKLWTILQ